MDLSLRWRRPPVIAAFLILATGLAGACGPSLHTPNVLVKRFDPLSLGAQADLPSSVPVCKPAELVLPTQSPTLTKLPALCRDPNCRPVAQDCDQLELWCTGREAALDHGLDQPIEAFQSLCALASQCRQLELQHRQALSRLADVELLFATLEGEEQWSMQRYLERLHQTRPDLAAQLDILKAHHQAVTSLLCQGFPAYLAALAAAGGQMVEGHNGGMQHVAFVLGDLPATPQQVLARMGPVSDAYQRLVDAHRLYRQVTDSGGFVAVPKSVLKAKPGVRTAETDALRQRLAQEGLLRDGKPGPIDTEVLNALGQLRMMHGVEGGALLGEATWELLQIPAAAKQAKVGKALRAIRAAIPPWEPTFIHVQSPHAFLELYLDGKVASHHRTVLGSARWDYNESKRKKERMYRTPTLNSLITEVILNPEWKVPESIATKEIAPKAAEDPGFLERGNYRVVEYSNGTQLFIQNPGDGNALGRIKFYFENPFGVYLHDTPSKRFFNFRIRLFSHGCVRVQHASKLAFILLNRDQNISEQDIRVWLRGRKPRPFPLIHPIPIHITYHTAGADSSGNLYFLKDYYGLEN